MREILSDALGTFAFSVLMQVPRRLLFFTTFGGLLSGTVYQFAEENGMGAFGCHPMGHAGRCPVRRAAGAGAEDPIHRTALPLYCAPAARQRHLLRHAIPVVGQPDQAVAYAAQTLQIATGMGLGAVLVAVLSAYCAHIENKNNAPYRDGPRARCIFIFFLMLMAGIIFKAFAKPRSKRRIPPPHTGGTNRQTAAHGKWQFLAPAPRSPLW